MLNQEITRNMMTPRVSVISTVYNGELYFERAIPSVLAQTLTDIEYIIVDDGSTDKTPQLLEKLARQDNRIKLFFPGRLGRAKALNYAVEKARAPYIANQDFDDVSYPQRLQRQADFLDNHQRVGVVGCNSVIIDTVRRERYIRKPPLCHHELRRTLVRYIPFVHSLVMFRKTAWKQAGGYPDLNDLEDLKLWITFVKINWRLANIDEVLGEHWVHPNSFWHRNYRYYNRQLKLAKINYEAIRELKLPIWMVVYPFSRIFYPIIPTFAKRFIRRKIHNMVEDDINT